MADRGSGARGRAGTHGAKARPRFRFQSRKQRGQNPAQGQNSTATHVQLLQQPPKREQKKGGAYRPPHLRGSTSSSSLSSAVGQNTVVSEEHTSTKHNHRASRTSRAQRSVDWRTPQKPSGPTKHSMPASSVTAGRMPNNDKLHRSSSVEHSSQLSPLLGRLQFLERNLSSAIATRSSSTHRSASTDISFSSFAQDTLDILAEIHTDTMQPAQVVFQRHQVPVAIRSLCAIMHMFSSASCDALEPDIQFSLHRWFSNFVCEIALKSPIKFDTQMLRYVVNTLLHELDQAGCASKTHLVRALGHILFENGCHLGPLAEPVIRLLLQYALPRTTPTLTASDEKQQDHLDRMKLQHATVFTLGSMCIGAGDILKDYYGEIFQVLILLLERAKSAGEAGEFDANGSSSFVCATNMLRSVLQALFHLVPEAKTAHTADMLTLASCIRSTMTWGTCLHSGSDSLPPRSAGTAGNCDNFALSNLERGLSDGPIFAIRSLPSNEFARWGPRFSVSEIAVSGGAGSSRSNSAQENRIGNANNKNTGETPTNQAAVIRSRAHALSPFFSPDVIDPKRNAAPVSPSDSTRTSCTPTPTPTNAKTNANVNTNTSKDTSIVVSSDRSDNAASISDPIVCVCVLARLYALHLLRTLVRVTPAVFFAHWKMFVPEDVNALASYRPTTRPNILQLILTDPSDRVRHASAVALTAILEGSPLQQWASTFGKVSTSNTRRSKQAFTSMSARYASILYALHVGLLKALQSEQAACVSFAARAQILSCLTVMVSRTPYNFLRTHTTARSRGHSSGQLPFVAPIVVYLCRTFLRVGTGKIAGQRARHAVFAALAALFGTADPIPELEALLQRSETVYTVDSDANALLHTSSSTSRSRPTSASSTRDSQFSSSVYLADLDVISLLMVHAKQRVMGDPTPDAFVVLSRIASNYPHTLCPYWGNPSATLVRVHTSAVDEAASTAAPSALTLRRSRALTLFGILCDALHHPLDMQMPLLALKLIEAWCRTDVSKLCDRSFSIAAYEAAAMASSSSSHDAVNMQLHAPTDETPQGFVFFSLPASIHLLTSDLPKVFDGNKEQEADVKSTTSASVPIRGAAVNTKPAAIRSKVLSCLAYIPESVWLTLSSEQTATILSLCLRALNDTSQSVRMAACRVIGVLGIYPAVMRSHPLELNQCIDALRLLLVPPGADPVVSVRVKACWALANICDIAAPVIESKQATPASNYDIPISEASDSLQLCGAPFVDIKLPPRTLPFMQPPSRAALHTSLPRTQYVGLVEASLVACEDNDKVAANAVRSMGHLGRWLYCAPPAVSASVGTEMPVELRLWCHICAVLRTRLVSNTSVKNQWNTCYAIGSLLRNPILPQFLVSGYEEPRTEIDELLGALVNVASTHENYKVRINAAIALSAPPFVEHFHNSFGAVYVGIANALRALETETAPSYPMYRYKVTLRLQLVHTLTHVCRLCAERYVLYVVLL
jgi:Domain of unknown function (DUF4042)/HEAT repeat